MPAPRDNKPQKNAGPSAEAAACGNCRHFRAIAATGVGFCRRYPPSVQTLKLTADGPVQSFPIVNCLTLCGEHSRAE